MLALGWITVSLYFRIDGDRRKQVARELTWRYENRRDRLITTD